MKLYMIRHGESEGNKAGKIQGTKDFPLTELGEKQAEAVAEFAKTIQADYVYSSDLTRASQTATAIGQAVNQPVREWELLREVKLGKIEGLTREEIGERYPALKGKHLVGATIEGAETKPDISKRCSKLINQLQTAHRQGETILLVSHGGFISALLMYLIIGEGWENAARPFVIGNTSVTLVEWRDDTEQCVIHYTNRTAHLDTVQTDLQVKRVIL